MPTREACTTVATLAALSTPSAERNAAAAALKSPRRDRTHPLAIHRRRVVTCGLADPPPLGYLGRSADCLARLGRAFAPQAIPTNRRGVDAAFRQRRTREVPPTRPTGLRRRPRNRSRLRYLLYPRRVHTFDRTSATVKKCPFLAVFRDTDQNLAVEPFTGRWRHDELRERVHLLQLLNESAAVAVYGVP